MYYKFDSDPTIDTCMTMWKHNCEPWPMARAILSCSLEEISKKLNLSCRSIYQTICRFHFACKITTSSHCCLPSNFFLAVAFTPFWITSSKFRTERISWLKVGDKVPKRCGIHGTPLHVGSSGQRLQVICLHAAKRCHSQFVTILCSYIVKFMKCFLQPLLD